MWIISFFPLSLGQKRENKKFTKTGAAKGTPPTKTHKKR